MDPWYKVARPREEVREGRSFDPNEFAIHLEQVISGRGAEDYLDPDKFFARNVFTRALKDHAGMVLRRLAGRTESTAPVLTLVTQFGGGKTHTLTALYHLVRAGKTAADLPGVAGLLESAGLPEVPRARVAAFVGNAWDPEPSKETPWLDVAVQLAGSEGVAALGPSAQSTAPGTTALARLFEAAGGKVLILLDEVLNFCNRYRPLADSFYAFIQNLTVAMTGMTHSAAVISLPRSQVEMTDWDLQWQERITKVVHRVAKDLIANDEAEISEVLRRRLFESLGPEKVRRTLAKLHADWCFERRARLPAEWTAVDSASTESKAREFLMSRFEACYPFHPSTLSVFQRKWQALPQYQQTRGTLAMLAQWVSWAYREGYQKLRREAFLTLGSAPLHVPEFRSAVLGQLGEPRLAAAIEADIAGAVSHARALDADAKPPLNDLHRRVGAAILFESSGGQRDKIAHLPDLRFALGEPDVETTSIDNAAMALEARAFFIRKVSSDGYQIRHQATLKKVVNDRRASLDPDGDVRPAMRTYVKEEFKTGAPTSPEWFPKDSSAVPNSPRLTIVVVEPEVEWTGAGAVRDRISEWTRLRGGATRDYPAALVWCLKKPGRELYEKVELTLAWQRVERDLRAGVLGADVDPADRADVAAKLKDAQEAARDEVWASYRFVVIADAQEPDGLRAIDLGAGHASSREPLCGRILAALKSDGRLSESVGASYLDRNWPPALKDSGAWPLKGLRKSFFDGSLIRLLDPDAVLRAKIPEFVQRGDFGFASGATPDGGYQRLWLEEPLPPDEIVFDHDVYLLRKDRARALRQPAAPEPQARQPELPPSVSPSPQPVPAPPPPETPQPAAVTIHVTGAVPPESWDRFGSKLIPKLRSGQDLNIRVDLSCRLDATTAPRTQAELRQLIEDLGLTGQVRVEP